MSVYRYTIAENVSLGDVQDSLMLAVLAMECLHGPAQTRLDLVHDFAPGKRSWSIDATTEVGRDLNCLFTGFLHKEFGAQSFRVERVVT
jgi:hypothetical protein